MTRIGIIGAGIAGLACARGLSKAGANVRVFDKARGPGGRMSTRRVQTSLGEVSFDHGAQYFTARDPAFLKHVQHLTDQGAVDVWRGCLVKLDNAGVSAPLASEPLFVGTPGMNAVVKAAAQGLEVAWNTRVGQINQDGNKMWQLFTEDGLDLGVFDQIVCAVPAEQVHPLLHEAAPDFAQLSQSVTSLPCWAGLFAFDAPIAMPFDAIKLTGHEMIDVIAMNVSKPGRDGPASYVVHARGDWSAQNLELDGDAIWPQLLAGLLSFADNRPTLIHAIAHRWRYARVEIAHGSGFAFDENLRVGLCGDWLAGPRVEAAWLSGHQLAITMNVALHHAGTTTLGKA